jgi:hypothetical protein
LIQGVYYLVAGVWPLVSMSTFLAVTGPKTDLWLVDTVGVLVAVIGITLLAGAWRGRAAAEVAILAIGSALALTGIDVIYVMRGVIGNVYLLDAGAEVFLIAVWVAALGREACTRGGDRCAPCL